MILIESVHQVLFHVRVDGEFSDARGVFGGVAIRRGIPVVNHPGISGLVNQMGLIMMVIKILMFLMMIMMIIRRSLSSVSIITIRVF